MEELMSVRIIDLIATNIGQETTNSQLVTDIRNTYNPSNLGSGFARDENGNISVTNEQISFDMIFNSDTETGYAKYTNLVTTLTQYELVWLRYAIPTTTGYTFAYRPGYVSGITKTEAKYANASLVEKVTVSTLDSWMRLYTFTPEQAAISLHPANANNLQELRLFTDYSDYYKQVPFAYPYYYRKVVEQITKDNMTVMPTSLNRRRGGSWYTKFGNVLSKTSNVYKIYAIHAPSMSVSTFERETLEAMSTNLTYSQMTKIKGKSFASEEPVDKYTMLRNKSLETRKKVRSLINRKSTTFKASIHNYSHSIPNDGPFRGEYTSYLLRGSAQAGGTVSITAKSGIVTNQLRFLTDGPILIDTALFANHYSCAGSSVNIDFTKFFKTTANSNNEILQANKVTLDTIIMRESILAI